MRLSMPDRIEELREATHNAITLGEVQDLSREAIDLAEQLQTKVDEWDKVGEHMLCCSMHSPNWKADRKCVICRLIKAEERVLELESELETVAIRSRAAEAGRARE